MLFKFASFLLGTNNGDESKPEQLQQLSTESNAIQDTQPTSSTEEAPRSTLSEGDNPLTDQANLSDKQDLIEEEEDDYMYAEQLINCSKLKNSNCNLEATDLVKEDQLGDQLDDDEDCEDEQWIYITPIRRKNEEEKQRDEPKFVGCEPEEANCVLIDDEKDAPNANVPKQQDDQEKEQFNFYDYFNNKSSLTGNLATLNEEEQQCSPAKSSKLSPSSSSAARKLANHKVQQAARGMEESWVIQPPECFLLPNTFTIEEHPLENLYIENPALSVMASCKSIDKENNSTSSSTNSSSLNNSTAKSSRVLVDRTLSASQTNGKPSVASRKSMRKRANSTRKANKKQQNSKKSKGQTKTDDLAAVATVAVSAAAEQSAPVEQEQENAETGEPKQPALDGPQEKRLLAHYLALNPDLDLALAAVSNPIASLSNGSTHHSTTHHPHHHFISNNCVATFNASTNASVEHKKGSKSLRRNNKVKIRDNLSNRPFTLHRKLC